MNALSRLLTRVALRVMKNSPSNGDILETADRVVAWSNAGYVSESQVDEIANAVPTVEPEEEAEVLEVEDMPETE